MRHLELTLSQYPDPQEPTPFYRVFVVRRRYPASINGMPELEVIRAAVAELHAELDREIAKAKQHDIDEVPQRLTKSQILHAGKPFTPILHKRTIHTERTCCDAGRSERESKVVADPQRPDYDEPTLGQT